MNLSDLLTLSIVSHGHGQLLVRLLQDLDRLPSLGGVSVLVTLNLPEETLAGPHFDNIKIKTIHNLSPKGFAANHNAAFQHCHTPWFGVLNPDLQIPSDIFVPMMKFAITSPENQALLAPSVVNSAGHLEDSSRFNLTPWAMFKRIAFRETQTQSRAHAPTFRWYAGMFYLIRARSYVSVGGFDENFFLYCEDFDFCARLHLAKFKMVYMDEVRVVHDAQRNSHRTARHLRWHLVSLMRVWLSLPVWRIAVQDVGKRLGRTRNI